MITKKSLSFSISKMGAMSLEDIRKAVRWLLNFPRGPAKTGASECYRVRAED